EHRLNNRLQDLSFPLLAAATDQCANRTTYKLGLQLHTAEDYPENQQEAAQQVFDELDGIRVKHSAKGTSAREHLLRGDKIIQINGDKVPNSTANTIRRLKQQLLKGPSLELTIERNDRLHSITLTAVEVCDYPVQLSQQDAINAFADGSSIIVNAGLMRFAQKDSELALIIAHELAHNVADHGMEKIKGGLIGGLFDLAISSGGSIVSPAIGVALGANLLSQSYEVEADKLAIRLMHQLDYPLQPLPEFWRRMATVHPSSIRHGQQASHPTTVERYLIMKQEVERLTQSDE
ncbi:M48 family metalloprotease, partial [Pontibacterium sp.]|uniref:M48 family metalloprotease n=1 Tax=Pontibacterium sp. TaxID=2036026 RepID=UPI0035688AD6